MKHLVNKEIIEKVPFMGDEVEVRKMSVSKVMELQSIVASAGKDEEGQLNLLRSVIRLAVIGSEEITDEEFNNFPLGELSALSEAIMTVSGLGASEGN